jgi:hypothetical protein
MYVCMLLGQQHTFPCIGRCACPERLLSFDASERDSCGISSSELLRTRRRTLRRRRLDDISCSSSIQSNSNDNNDNNNDMQSTATDNNNTKNTKNTIKNTINSKSDIQSWDFDALSVPEDELTEVVVAMFERLGVLRAPAPDLAAQRREVLRNFVALARRHYSMDNPYHNFRHCVDVTQATFMMLAGMRPSVPDNVCYAVLVAAVAHDLEHPGLNNAYLIKTKDPLAITYNDTSVLENRHAACLFELLERHPEADVFRGLDEREYELSRRLVIHAIIHTDMCKHVGILEDVRRRACTWYTRCGDKDETDDRVDQEEQEEQEEEPDQEEQEQEEEPRRQQEQQQEEEEQQQEKQEEEQQQRLLFLAATVLHAADISNPVRGGSASRAWAARIMDEFFAQGDRERLSGMPVSPLCDRHTTTLGDVQRHFIASVVAPLYEGMSRMGGATEHELRVFETMRRRALRTLHEVYCHSPSSLR